MLKSLFARRTLRTVYRRVPTSLAAETLEDRVVLSAAAIAPAAAPQVDAGVDTSLVTVTDITVNDVEIVRNRLVANATVVGTVLGGAFTQDVQIPLNLDGSSQGSTDILNLSLGPVNLDVLGLNVNLDNCEGGPITVDITAETGEGKLLGNLLAGIAGSLDDGLNLRQVLGGLTGGQRELLTTGLEGVLNGTADEPGVFDSFFAEAQQVDGDSSGRTTEILNLEVGAINLDLLGLVVETSEICLVVSAEEGPGNLLGNLLGSLAGLLDRADDLDDTLGGVTDAVTQLVTALTERLGSVAGGDLGDIADQLENVPGLERAVDRLIRELDQLDRIVDRVGDEIPADRLEAIIDRFAGRIVDVASRIDDVAFDRIDDLIERVAGIVDRLGDRLTEVARLNDRNEDRDDDDRDDDRGRDRDDDNGRGRRDDIFADGGLLDRLLSRI